ncbi:hypothetical protein BYT27DRAFT_7260957 [Phlegmacium glaucopus]|nr:hypothetical protein BYT27DRAFT_7260957 [Phlegmacium glaucopus]
MADHCNKFSLGQFPETFGSDLEKSANMFLKSGAAVWDSEVLEEWHLEKDVMDAGGIRMVVRRSSKIRQTFTGRRTAA